MASGPTIAQAQVEGKVKEIEGTGVAERNKTFWAARVAGSRNRERGTHLIHLPQEQGADRIVIPEEEWKAATSKFEQALVGFVFGSKPFLGRMKGFARAKWGDETVVKVSQLNEGIFLFEFVSEVNKTEVLSGGPWTFDNRPMILKSWSEEEEYKCGSVEALPVWIRLPRLKAHLADTIILSRLCSRIGTPICTDGVTADGSSYNYAGVCVQIHADQELMDRIEFEDPYGNINVQPVEYEWKPPRCHNCCNFGHLSDKCPEPNLERMIAGLKEREQWERERKDKRDVCEEEIESGEDTAMDKEQNNEALEPAESVCVPETQMNPSSNAKTLKEKEGHTSFVPYLSKSAQKRARQKAKRDSNSGESNDQGDTIKSTSSSHTRMKERRVQKVDIKAKQFEKMRREASLKKPLIDV
ncbi:unnamed protein product [Rhodiola kirilowii]